MMYFAQNVTSLSYAGSYNPGNSIKHIISAISLFLNRMTGILYIRTSRSIRFFYGTIRRPDRMLTYCNPFGKETDNVPFENSW